MRQGLPCLPRQHRWVPSTRITRRSPRAGRKARLRGVHRQHARQHPFQPRPGSAQVLAPGGVGDIGNPAQQAPGSQLAKGVAKELRGQQAVEELSGGLDLPLPLQGSQRLGLLLPPIGQAGSIK